MLFIAFIDNKVKCSITFKCCINTLFYHDYITIIVAFRWCGKREGSLYIETEFR